MKSLVILAMLCWYNPHLYTSHAAATVLHYRGRQCLKKGLAKNMILGEKKNVYLGDYICISLSQSQ